MLGENDSRANSSRHGSAASEGARDAALDTYDAEEDGDRSGSGLPHEKGPLHLPQRRRANRRSG